MNNYKVEFILTAKVDGEEIYKRTSSIADSHIFTGYLGDAMRAVVKKEEEIETEQEKLEEKFSTLSLEEERLRTEHLQEDAEQAQRSEMSALFAAEANL